MMSSVGRRRVLLGGVAMAGAGLFGRDMTALAQTPIANDPAPPGPSALWYRQSATQWVEALPIGNGRLGGMVFGGIAVERIQLNEDTFYAGGPYDSINPQGKAALPEIRKLVFDGQYREAQALADQTMVGRPPRQMAYQTVGDLIALVPILENATNYVRQLDLETAIARTTFRASSGLSGPASHEREVFASHPDQVIVMRMASRLQRRITANFAFATPQAASISVEDGHTLVMSGVGPDSQGIKGRVRFEARARVMPVSGTMTASPGGIYVAGADEVVVLVSVATSYRQYDDVAGDPVAINTARIAAAAARTYDELKARHVADHKALFDRTTIELERTASSALPTDERVRGFATTADPDLAALYVKYGRYLLISSSRPGTQPANLQGIWNDRTDPMWESKYTININIQMNYWPAGAGNLVECVEPLTRMVEELSVTGARVASEMYGARGWVVHHNTDLFRTATVTDAAGFGMWPMGGVWLLANLWDVWEITQDRAFLARIYPMMASAAEFFLDTLQDHPTRGYLVTNPSMSPENRHPFGSTICAGPAADTQKLRGLFDNVAAASRLLGRDAALRRQVLAARARLAPDQIGKGGQLQEWLEDWDLEAPDQRHRHMSHLYALHPASQITPQDTPELAEAAKVTLNRRGDLSTGWAIAWRMLMWARLKDGDRSHEILKLLLSPQRSYPNLFDAHPPFQIDGNFGGASGIIEMILQSHRGRIWLLPALPRAWGAGSARGLLAKGGYEVDLRWADGVLSEAVLRSRAGVGVEVRCGAARLPLKLAAGREAKLVMRDGRLVRT